ncbi:hypothetical protein Tco_0180235 [Tanacetum coccineum]
MDNVPPTPHDSPLSRGNTPRCDEGRMELIEELMETCTSLTKRVLALEEAKTTQDKVINRLNLRVKRLEKKRKARTPQPMQRRLFKGRVETSTNTILDSDFDILDAKQITTTGPSHVITADQMKEVKAKEKGVEFRNIEEASRPVRSITTLQPLPKIDLKDKGKSVLVKEEPKKVKRRYQGLAQIESDTELAQRLHEEELAELDRAQKERQRQEESINAALAEEFDEI